MLSMLVAAFVAVRPSFAQDSDLLAVAAADGNFDTFLSVVEAAGLSDLLQGAGPYTVFAPTDEAFAALSERERADLLEPANRPWLVALLRYHILPGEHTAADLQTGYRRTIDNRSVRIKVRPHHTRVNAADVDVFDRMASNGVIHGIDRVMRPAYDEGRESYRMP